MRFGKPIKSADMDASEPNRPIFISRELDFLMQQYVGKNMGKFVRITYIFVKLKCKNRSVEYELT